MANQLHILSNISQGEVFKDNLTEELDSLVVVYNSIGAPDIKMYDLVKLPTNATVEVCPTCVGSGVVAVHTGGYYECEYCYTRYDDPTSYCANPECSNFQVLVIGGYLIYLNILIMTLVSLVMGLEK